MIRQESIYYPDYITKSHKEYSNGNLILHKEYDKEGNLTYELDYNGYWYRDTYLGGLKTHRIDKFGLTWDWTYLIDGGHKLKRTALNGEWGEDTYDILGNRTEARDSSGEHITWEYKGLHTLKTTIIS